MTRTENSTKNIYTGLINQILILIFRFVTRTVFVKTLGSEFLGINGLFSNILTLLSLADLGIGGALVYSLYKPIEEKDKTKQIIITNYLRKVYRNIGIAIMIIGICLLPFLNYIITEKVTIVNIYLVFIIYVFQSASSYLFFASRTEFLGAQQKRYIYNNICNVVTILSNITQIIILLLTKNFILYLFVIIGYNILQAYLVSKKTEELYPYITENVNGELSREEKKNIFKDCGSLMIQRINYVVLTATDNIIISKYLSLSVVGLYSNYVLITNSIVNILNTFFQSINASLGNLHVSNQKEHEYFIFKLINFITVISFGVCAIGIYVLANDFIELWLGSEYQLSKLFVFIIAINLYIEGLRKFLATYRNSYGLFRQAKFLPLLGVFINIIASIFLVKRIGIFGVLLGTFLSNLLTFMWFDPYIIYKKVFKKNVLRYYLTNIGYLLLFMLLGLLCNKVCDLITIKGIIGFIIHGIICVSIPTTVIFVMFYKSTYFKYLKEPLLKIINNKLKRKVK